HSRKKFLLILVEHFSCLNHRAAAESVFAVIEPRRHYYHVLLAGICTRKYLTQVVQVAWVAHRNQDIACPYAERSTSQLLISIHSELVQSFTFAGLLAGDSPLRVGKNAEEYSAKDYPRDRGILLGEQICHCRKEQNGGDDGQPDWYFLSSNVDVAGHLPLPILGLGIT